MYLSFSALRNVHLDLSGIDLQSCGIMSEISSFFLKSSAVSKNREWFASNTTTKSRKQRMETAFSASLVLWYHSSLQGSGEPK